MPRLVLVFHPTCYSSFLVVKHLYKEGLIDRVHLVNSSKTTGHAGTGLVWSVPWITVDGIPAGTDPISGEEVALMVKGGFRGGEVDPVKRFMEAVPASAYASALLALHMSIEPLMDRGFISAITRSPFTGLPPSDAMKEILDNKDYVLEELLPRASRALAVNMARDLWWSGLDKPEPPSREFVGSWLIAKAGIGRVGLPSKPLLERHRGVEALIEILESEFERLLFRVAREQRAILGDREYWALLESLGVS